MVMENRVSEGEIQDVESILPAGALAMPSTSLKQEFRGEMQPGFFLDRRLGASVNWPDVIVLALPRGGVPVAFAV